MESKMDRYDVELIDRSTKFQGFNRIDSYKLRHKQFDGNWSDEIEREVFERGHGVVVIAFDPVQDKLVLIEQFRHGAYAALSSPWFDEDASPWTVECVAGNIEEGETPEAVASRELYEEAGCKIQDIIPVGHYLVSPSGSSQSVFVYCARVAAPDTGGLKGLQEEGEDICVHSVPVKTVFEWLDNGKFVTLGAVYCMVWFRANYNDLRRCWGDGE